MRADLHVPDFSSRNLRSRDRTELALIVPGDAAYSVGDLVDRCDQLANGLRAAGLERGAVIVASMANSAELLLLALASIQSGIYFTPVNPALTAEELAYILLDCGASALVVGRFHSEAVTAAADSAGIASDRRFSVSTSPGFRPLSELSEGHPSEPLPDAETGELLFYTSGTTGRPKGVWRPLANEKPVGILSDFRVPSTFSIACTVFGPHLSYLPHFLKGPLLLSLRCLHFGKAVVLSVRPNPERFLELVSSFDISSTNADPHLLTQLAKLPLNDRRKYDCSSLQAVIHSGGPCPRQTKESMIEWWGPVIWEVYGNTEAGTVAYASSEDWLERPGTVGRVIAGADVKIVDANGVECPPGQSGSIYIRPPKPLKPFVYLNDPDKTNAVRQGDYFTVGDVGYLDADGWLFLTSRTADIINRKGANVYSSEVEAVIQSHPAVVDTAVIGTPSGEFEEITAIVVLAQHSAEDKTVTLAVISEEIMGLCRRALAPHKWPSRITYRSELPRSERGKLLREQLREEFWRGLDRRI